MNAMWYFAFVTPLNYRQAAVTENLDYYSSIGIYHDQPQTSSVVYSTDSTEIICVRRRVFIIRLLMMLVN